jgi:hypothetical protein
LEKNELEVIKVLNLHYPNASKSSVMGKLNFKLKSNSGLIEPTFIAFVKDLEAEDLLGHCYLRTSSMEDVYFAVIDYNNEETIGKKLNQWSMTPMGGHRMLTALLHKRWVHGM